MSKGRRFYQDGIRFECQGEGKCCISRGRYGYVYLSFNDRRRLAVHLGITNAEFASTYANKVDGLYELKYTGKDCPFLKRGRCDVYDARPGQCRTWPFWPENMNSVVWERDVASWCPGVGRGRLYTADEIEDILKTKRSIS